jgi:hypothetical protein
MNRRAPGRSRGDRRKPAPESEARPPGKSRRGGLRRKRRMGAVATPGDTGTRRPHRSPYGERRSTARTSYPAGSECTHGLPSRATMTGRSHLDSSAMTVSASTKPDATRPARRSRVRTTDPKTHQHMHHWPQPQAGLPTHSPTPAEQRASLPSNAIATFHSQRLGFRCQPQKLPTTQRPASQPIEPRRLLSVTVPRVPTGRGPLLEGPPASP